MTVWTRWRKPVFLERSVRVNDGGEKQTLVIFLTWIYMLLQSVTIVARKLLVDGKITVCVKQICLQRVVCKGKRQLSGETFCLLEKRSLSTSKHCASSNLLFFYKLPTTNFAHNQLSLNVLLLHVFPVIRLVNFV